MGAYYNEHDPFAAAWLRELIAQDLIAPGDVDERDIQEVTADDLQNYTQCHFFAGIGGWSYALRLAGWPDDRPVWTGSCPCQPLSSAGKQKGHADERHLWPAFHALIAECRPATVFGEQVASKLGREWLAGVRADLEDARYAVGAADLCAAGVGAPHIRQRLFWVGNAEQSGSQGRDSPGHLELHGKTQPHGPAWASGVLSAIENGRLGDAECQGLEGSAGAKRDSKEPTEGCRPVWRGSWLKCADQKHRRIPPQSEVFPLAHGIPNRVGTLRGAGNAIVPALAAEFIRASRGRGD